MRARIAIVAADVAAMLTTWAVIGTQAQAADRSITFKMVRSSAAADANCLPAADATVRVVARADSTCPGAVTPFNGDHTAGVQAMSTRNFPDLEGPLSQLMS